MRRGSVFALAAWTALLLASAPARPALAANAQAGTSAGQFLKLGAGARAGALGEAQIGLVDDAYAAYYNPAGLTRTSRPMGAGMHESRFKSISYEFLALSYPILEGESAKQVFAASIYSLSVSGIERRENDTDLALGSFEAGDSAYALSWACRVSDELSLGVTAKHVHSSIDVVGASAQALDLGLQYRLGTQRPVTFGLVVRNLGTKLDYGLGGDPLPRTFGAGAAVSLLPGLTVDLDLLKPRDWDAYFALGAEFKHEFSKSFGGALRAGYTNHYQQLDGTKGVSAGAGLTFDPVTVDFAWIPFGDLGTNFRYSLSVRF